MKNVSGSTVSVLVLFALVIFMTWGALGGWSGTMGLGMGTSFDGAMTFVGMLAFVVFFAALVLWVWRNWRRKK